MSPVSEKKSLPLLAALVLTSVTACDITTTISRSTTKNISAHSEPKSFEYTNDSIRENIYANDPIENYITGDNLNNPDPRYTFQDTPSYRTDINFALNYKKNTLIENPSDTTVTEKRLKSINDVDNELIRSI